MTRLTLIPGEDHPTSPNQSSPDPASRHAEARPPIQHDRRTFVCPKCTDSILPAAWCSMCQGSELVTEAQAKEYLNPLDHLPPYYTRESVKASAPTAAVSLLLFAGIALGVMLWHWFGFAGFLYGVMGLLVVSVCCWRPKAEAEEDAWDL